MKDVPKAAHTCLIETFLQWSSIHSIPKTAEITDSTLLGFYALLVPLAIKTRKHLLMMLDSLKRDRSKMCIKK